MSREIWISSDHHLFHSNILGFTDSKTKELIRPGFDNVRQMNEFILERHNSRVKPNDIWYCVGDITMHYGPDFDEIIKKFHGRKRLIVGNHDDIKKLAKGDYFQKIQMWRMFVEFQVVLTHVPLHINSLRRGAPDSDSPFLLNVHGHIHQNDSPNGPYYNASLEKTNYYPVCIEDIKLDDGFGSQWVNSCPECGFNGGLEIVRPGKIQCNNCE